MAKQSSVAIVANIFAAVLSVWPHTKHHNFHIAIWFFVWISLCVRQTHTSILHSLIRAFVSQIANNSVFLALVHSFFPLLCVFAVNGQWCWQIEADCILCFVLRCVLSLFWHFSLVFVLHLPLPVLIGNVKSSCLRLSLVSPLFIRHKANCLLIIAEHSLSSIQTISLQNEWKKALAFSFSHR